MALLYASHIIMFHPPWLGGVTRFYDFSLMLCLLNELSAGPRDTDLHPGNVTRLAHVVKSANRSQVTT